MNNLNVITKSFVVMIVILMIAGAIIGLQVKDSDLVNPFRNKAAADQNKAETQKDMEKWEIEKPYYQKEREAESVRRIAEINAEILIMNAEAQAKVDRIIGTAINKNKKDALQNDKESMWTGVIASLAKYIGISGCVVGSYLTIKVVNRNFQRSRSVSWERNVEVLDYDAYARKKAIAAARQRERETIARSRHLLQVNGSHENNGYRKVVNKENMYIG